MLFSKMEHLSEVIENGVRVADLRGDVDVGIAIVHP